MPGWLLKLAQQARVLILCCQTFSGNGLIVGVDEISIRQGHTYRIVVGDVMRGRPIWFGGTDRSEASMSRFYTWLGANKSSRIRVAIMDMVEAVPAGDQCTCAAP